MKKDIFRPITFWKSAVMTMPDNSFFELMRSVFGKIKTPFNKQQLLNDLEKFLLRADIQNSIAAYIDETEAKIIAAVSLFAEPAPEQLEAFFLDTLNDDLNYARLQDAIVNLEERFIMYRFTEEKTSRLALNPVLKQILLPITEDASALFPIMPANKTSIASSIVKANKITNDLFLAALFSFVSKQDSFYKSEGVIKKRVIEEGKKLFPGIDLENILGSLQILDLFYIDTDKLIPAKKRFDDFGSISAHERTEYCAAALSIYSGLTPPFEILPPLFRSKIKEILNLIRSLLDSLNAEFQYSEKTIKRIIEVLKVQMNTRIKTELLIEALEKTGLIAKTQSKTYLNGSNTQKKANNTGPVIAITGSSILVYPEINFLDAINLANIFNICEASTVVRFELDKDCAVRAFDNNINAKEIIHLLDKLGGKASEALVWNLKDWEKRHGEVSLKKGVILRLAENHRYLTETEPFISFISETLAPGLYLLNENAADDTVIQNAIEALQKSGIDIIARRKEKKEIAASITSHFSGPSSSPLHFLKSESSVNSAARKDSAALTAQYHATLEKMSLSDTEKTELAARIDRRLVLCEAQLKDADIRYEKLEARHMDYTGKQLIAKQAISQQSPLEITWMIKGKEKSIFGIPRTLEKEGGDLILVIDANRIPLAKISLLRRIKRSIFEK